MKVTLRELAQKEFDKIIFAEPSVDQLYKKTVVKKISGDKYQAERFTQTQAFHYNFNDLAEFLEQEATKYSSFYLLGSENYTCGLKNGQVIWCKKSSGQSNPTASNSHNKQKNYLIKEGEEMPIFVKLGIFTKEFKVVNSMQEKYRQINRYLEMLGDILKDYQEGDEIYVVDYCSGKSYLSFAVYHYLHKVKKLKVTLDGIDLKADVIAKCNQLSRQYGYENMNFYALDVKEFVPKKQIDLAISLHACDVATDYVLYSAVKNNAKRIFAAPCCQHECANTLSYDYEPLLNCYGILNQRVAALLTDSVRCALLELNGYKTEIMEFVDITDSPKNLLIRGIKTHRPVKFLEIKRKELDDLLKRTQAHFTAVDLLYPRE